MTGKWVQAENGKDEKVDVYVWVETPEPSRGIAETAQPAESPRLLGPDGKPLSPKPRFGFDTARTKS